MAHDLAIRVGRIVTISGFRTDAQDVISATDNIVMPGGIEAHCHIAQESGMG
jgi:dihydropyrimidinase